MFFIFFMKLEFININYYGIVNKFYNSVQKQKNSGWNKCFELYVILKFEMLLFCLVELRFYGKWEN